MANTQELEKYFTHVYKSFYWHMGSGESRSGMGSTLAYTGSISQILEMIHEKLDIQTFLDTSCGDWNWMKHIRKNLKSKYIGLDIVKDIVDVNNTNYGDNQTTFVHSDMLSYFKNMEDKSIDLCLCRHTLEHLPTQYIKDCLLEFKRVCKYVLVTSAKDGENSEVSYPWGYRKVNLNQTPYIEIIGEPMNIFLDGPSDCKTESAPMHFYKFN